MGKNLKGKECGKGICQRKDGKYAARYTAKDGSLKERHFDTLPEARNWLADAGFTTKQAYIAIGTMFWAAVMNDMLTKHPMDGVRYTKPVRAVDDIKFLTVEEEKIFLETAKRSHNCRQYRAVCSCH